MELLIKEICSRLSSGQMNIQTRVNLQEQEQPPLLVGEKFTAVTNFHPPRMGICHFQEATPSFLAILGSQELPHFQR